MTVAVAQAVATLTEGDKQKHDPSSKSASKDIMHSIFNYKHLFTTLRWP